MAEKIEFYDSKSERASIIDREQELGFYVKNDDFVDGSGKPTDGNSGRLTFTNEEAPSELNMAPITLVLKKSTIIFKDGLPSNMDDLQVFLEEEKKYSFRFRLLRYTTDVHLAMGFIVPGDKDHASMAWNVVTFGGDFLSDDDESTLKQKGINIIGPEVSGIIITKSEAGLFIPQVRQVREGAENSIISEAFLEVSNGSI